MLIYFEYFIWNIATTDAFNNINVATFSTDKSEMIITSLWIEEYCQDIRVAYRKNKSFKVFIVVIPKASPGNPSFGMTLTMTDCAIIGICGILIFQTYENTINIYCRYAIYGSKFAEEHPLQRDIFEVLLRPIPEK